MSTSNERPKSESQLSAESTLPQSASSDAFDRTIDREAHLKQLDKILHPEKGTSSFHGYGPDRSSHINLVNALRRDKCSDDVDDDEEEGDAQDGALPLAPSADDQVRYKPASAIDQPPGLQYDSVMDRVQADTHDGSTADEAEGGQQNIPHYRHIFSAFNRDAGQHDKFKQKPENEQSRNDGKRRLFSVNKRPRPKTRDASRLSVHADHSPAESEVSSSTVKSKASSKPSFQVGGEALVKGENDSDANMSQMTDKKVSFHLSESQMQEVLSDEENDNTKSSADNQGDKLEVPNRNRTRIGHDSSDLYKRLVIGSELLQNRQLEAGSFSDSEVLETERGGQERESSTTNLARGESFKTNVVHRIKTSATPRHVLSHTSSTPGLNSMASQASGQQQQQQSSVLDDKADKDGVRHDLFVELDLLDHDKWIEVARWIKYEEDRLFGSDRWGDPHLSPLSFHSVISLRRCFESGLVLLDIEAKDMSDAVHTMVDGFIQEGMLPASQQAEVLQVLLLKHSHVESHGSQVFKNLRNWSHLSLGTHHGEHDRRSGTAMPTPRSLVGIKLLESRHHRASVNHAQVASDSEGELTERETSRKEPSILRCIRPGTEGSIVLCGRLEGLKRPVTSFVRLTRGILMPNALEVPLPMRFIFVLLTPKLSTLDHLEIGRAFSTIMADKHFHNLCYKSVAREDILLALSDFLDQTIVLPPSDLDSDKLLSLKDLDTLRGRQLKFRRRVERSCRPEHSTLHPTEERKFLMANATPTERLRLERERSQLFLAEHQPGDDSDSDDGEELAPDRVGHRSGRSESRRTSTSSGMSGPFDGSRKTSISKMSDFDSDSESGFSGDKRRRKQRFWHMCCSCEGHLDPSQDPMEKTGFPFGGLINDITRRYPHYLSDFIDGLNAQCMATTIFIYFACLSGAVAFGGLMSDKTDNHIGISETLIISSMSGILFSLFAGQPLVITGVTGPVLLYDEALYNMSASLGVEFLVWRVWIGIWIAILALVIAAFEGSTLVKFFTRFTKDIFASLVSLLFIYEAFSKLHTIFEEHPLVSLDVYCNETIARDRQTMLTMLAQLNDSTQSTDIRSEFTDLLTQSSFTPPVLVDSQTTPHVVIDQETAIKREPNTALLSAILMFGTFFISYFLRIFRNGRFLGRTIRRALGDFGVPISIVAMVVVDQLIHDTFTEKLDVPTGLAVTDPNLRGWFIHPFLMNSNPFLTVATALPAALLLYTLLYMETHICELLIKEKSNAKGCGIHMDIVLLCVINCFGSFLGGPWICAATVRAVSHVSSLTVMSTMNAPGEHSIAVAVRDQRLTNLVVSILVGVSILLAPVLQLVPYAVLFGIFLYMGVSSIHGIHFFERLKLFFLPVKYHDKELTYVRRVKTWKMHTYTLIQIVGLAILWGVKSTKLLALAFPFFVVMMVPLRMSLRYIFTPVELKALDGPHAGQIVGEEEPDFYDQAYGS